MNEKINSRFYGFTKLTAHTVVMFHFVPARRVSNYLFLLTFQRRRTLALNFRLQEKRI